VSIAWSLLCFLLLLIQPNGYINVKGANTLDLKITAKSMDSSSPPSPMKLRRKATTPLRERVVVGADADGTIDFRDTNTERFFPTRRRRLKKRNYVCMMLWGATAFFGAVRIGNSYHFQVVLVDYCLLT
jgi:hypothetical protein